MASDGRTAVAVFDFDGTLIAGDSFLPFLTRVAGRRAVVEALTRSLITGRGRDNTKAALIRRLLQDRDYRQISALGAEFAVELAGRIRPSMLHTLASHREKRHTVVIVSASLAVYLEPLGNLIGADAVLATRLAVEEDGRLTGELAGANVRGKEKVARLLSHLGEDEFEMWAYGDSRGDRELLARAANPNWVRSGRIERLSATRWMLSGGIRRLAQQHDDQQRDEQPRIGDVRDSDAEVPPGVSE
jgi:phosphatidylglycerophosphatase C